VVHRDLKPQNIVIEKDTRRVVLMDFGLARLSELAGQAAEGVAGTPEFMAPEQARGREVDGRADLYALGCVLYYMLTGRVLFPAQTPMAAALRHVEDTPPDPRTVRPEIPAWLARLIVRLLDKDPARRPSDAANVAEALGGPPGGGAWRRFWPCSGRRSGEWAGPCGASRAPGRSGGRSCAIWFLYPGAARLAYTLAVLTRLLCPHAQLERVRR